MNIYTLILCFIVLVIVPELLGLLITKFMNVKNNIFLAFVIGHLLCFAICQLLAIPNILISAKFTTLKYEYILILAIIATVSLIINFKNIKNIVLENVKQFKKTPKLLMIFAVILIGIQLFISFRYMHIDDDDAYYIGTANTTIETNTLFKYDGSTGIQLKKIPKRYAIGPFPIYIALMASIVNIYPAIFAHTLIPAILILLSYVIYGLIASEWFDKNKKAIFLFLIILSIVNIWGNYSVYTNHTFLLFRIWQGKAVLANIIIPAVWLFFIKAEKNKFRIIDCLLLLLVILAGTLTTTMGIGLPAITLLLLSFIFSIKNKKASYMVKSFICCIPAYLYGILYLML